MNEQENEHLEHEAGRASEFQNCASEASALNASRNLDVELQIASLIKDGRFPVVCYSPAYCKVTDAIVGERRSILGAFGDRAAAERTVAGYYESGEFDGEERYEVLPRLSATRTNTPIQDDGIPF